MFNSSSTSLSHVSNHSKDGNINGGSNGSNIGSNIADYSLKNRSRNNRQQSTACKKRRGATKGSMKRSTNTQQSGDELESSLSQLIHATLKRTKDNDQKSKDNGADIAALATNFKQTADALGGRVQAALAFNKFKMFLTAEEKREFKQIQDEQEDDDECLPELIII
jgi:hypothetical protein